MRLTADQIEVIRQTVRAAAGEGSRVRLFGSRLDHTQRGGDIDLLVEIASEVARPALLAAQISGRLTRAPGGRRVDVLLCAPNLKRQPIHEQALTTGVLL